MWPTSIAYLTRRQLWNESFVRVVLCSEVSLPDTWNSLLSRKNIKVPTAICRVYVPISLSPMNSISRYYISFYCRNFLMTFLRWYTNTSCTVVIYHSCLLTNPYLHISVYIQEHWKFFFFFCKQRGSVFPSSLGDFDLVITSFSPMDICKHDMNHD